MEDTIGASALLETIRNFGPVFYLVQWSESIGPWGEYFWLIFPFFIGLFIAGLFWLVTAQLENVFGGGRLVMIWLFAFLGSFFAWCWLRTGDGFFHLMRSFTSDDAGPILFDAVRVAMEVSGGFTFLLWKLSGIEAKQENVTPPATVPELARFESDLDRIYCQYQSIVRKANITAQGIEAEIQRDAVNSIGQAVSNFAQQLSIAELPEVKFHLANGRTESLSIEEITGGAVAAGGGLAALLVPVTTTSGWWIFATTTTAPLLALAPPVGIAVGLGGLAVAGGGAANLWKRHKHKKERREHLIRTFRLRLDDIRRWASTQASQAAQIAKNQPSHSNVRAKITSGERTRNFVAMLVIASILSGFIVSKLAFSSPAEQAGKWLRENYGNDARIERVESVERWDDGDQRVVGRISYDENGSRLTERWRFRIDSSGGISAKPLRGQ